MGGQTGGIIATELMSLKTDVTYTHLYTNHRNTIRVSRDCNVCAARGRRRYDVRIHSKVDSCHGGQRTV